MRKVEKQILEEIKRAERILLHLHLGPDGDSVGSVFAVWRWLEKLGKEVTVVSFDPIPEEFSFLEEVKRVKKADVAKLDFSKFDLWFALDAAWDNITKTKSFQLPKGLMLVNIDHHQTNEKFGKINLVLPDKSSTAEILFELFQIWKVKIDKPMATRLFLGIYEDTGAFSYFQYTTPESLKKGAKLLKLGANFPAIRTNVHLSHDLRSLKYWALVLGKMRINKKYRFSLSAVSYEEFLKAGVSSWHRAGAASKFGAIVKDTNFGVILTESQKGEVKGSLRSRTDFDVAKIAVAMGGGGHKAAAGFRAKGNLKDVERKLVSVIKKVSGY